MREIKFRGKRIDNGEWVCGDFCQDKDVEMVGILVKPKTPYELIDVNKANFYFILRQIDPKTVGQFTGLHDKNGKEVFEGDIVSYKLIQAQRIGVIGVSERFPNMADEFKIYKGLEYKPSQSYPITKGGEHYEVIGNIYENFELLETEKG